MGSRKMPSFDGAGFWRGSYAHVRVRLLRRVGVPEGDLAGLANRKYEDLPSDLRCDIETSGLREGDL